MNVTHLSIVSSPMAPMAVIRTCTQSIVAMKFSLMPLMTRKSSSCLLLLELIPTSILATSNTFSVLLYLILAGPSHHRVHRVNWFIFFFFWLWFSTWSWPAPPTTTSTGKLNHPGYWGHSWALSFVGCFFSFFSERLWQQYEVKTNLSQKVSLQVKLQNSVPHIGSVYHVAVEQKQTEILKWKTSPQAKRHKPSLLFTFITR